MKNLRISRPKFTEAEIWDVFGGRKIITLWEMTIILAEDGPIVLDELQTVAFNLPDSSEGIGAEVHKQVSDALVKAEGFCERFHLFGCKQRIRVFVDNILGGSTCTKDVIYNEFFALSQQIVKELAERKLVFIAPSKTDYLEQAALFGADVNRAFPLSQAEIKDAGNCLAVDLNTAAVFHLMRVAEHGLYALANHLGAKPNKPFPLPYSDWNEVITAMEVELKKRKDMASQMTRGAQKDEETTFYGALLESITYFRDKYRNPVSHLRGSYSDTQALDAYEEVRKFMEKLAERVKEAN